MSAVALLTVLSQTAAAETRVVVTIKPVHALVARVMEGTGRPLLLVTGSASPHTYALKPSDAKALNGADVFFRVSGQIEPFTEKIITSLPKSVRVVTLAESDGIELLDKRTGATFDAHVHGRGVEDHEDPAKEAGHEVHEHDESALRDGHVWLDPRNAKAMVESITMALVAAAPQDAEKLKANAVRLLADLDALEAEIGRGLTPVKGRPFAVFHDAYQYFERRFGLMAVGSITASPGVQPSAKRLIAIRNKIATLGASCVFAEPLFSPNLVATVTDGTRARAGTLDPEGTMIPEGPDAYFGLMRGLAAGLRGCLLQGD